MRINNLTKRLFGNKRLLVVFAVIVVLFGAAIVRKNANTEEVVEETKKHTVSAMTISEQGSFTSDVNLAGEIVPIQDSQVTSLVNGTVVFIAPIGSEVSRGDTLFVLSDDGISTNFTNAQIAHATSLQNVEQTRLITGETVTQSLLGLSSAQASLDLAVSNLETARSQSEAQISAAQNSAVVMYDSAYTVAFQSLTSLNGSMEQLDEYLYTYVNSTDSQLRIDTAKQANNALLAFWDTPTYIDRGDMHGSLDRVHGMLLEVKLLVDMTARLLQTAVAGDQFTDSTLSLAKSINTTNQTQVNQYLTNIIQAQNNLTNAHVNGAAGIQAAESQLELAQIQHNNAESGYASAQRSAELQVLGAENGLNATQSQLDQARVRFDSLALTAPFAGTVIQHYIDEGSQVVPGQRMVQVGRISAVKITLDVSAEDAGQLAVGDTVVVDGAREGRIASVQPAADAISGKVEVEVEVDNADGYFIAGDTTRVKISLEHTLGEGEVLLPLSAVTVDQNETFVWVLGEGDTVTKRGVELGDVYGANVSIIEGLSLGDRVVSQNGQFLQDGDEVSLSEG